MLLGLCSARFGVLFCCALLGCRYTPPLTVQSVVPGYYLSVLYKIRCNPMHPLNGALPGLYVPVQVTRGALVAHQYTNAPPHSRTAQYCKTFIPLSVTLWNVLADPVFDGERLRVSRAGQ